MRRAQGRRASGIFSILALMILAGCLANGSLDNPIGRSLGWFNYLNASDIRDACTGRSGERYRLIYNAVWGEQVRSYDIAAGPGDLGAALSARVYFPENLNGIDLRDPLELYRGQRDVVALSPADMAALRDTLRASDFDAATPRGLVLPSDGFYWVVAACRDGAFHYNAYVYPSPRFTAIRFDTWLLQHDLIKVAVNPPGPRPPRAPGASLTHRFGLYSIFDMTVGDDGLVGIGSIL